MSSNKRVVIQGVILAAGRGSRIFPLSQNFPKPLLPVLNKPVIEYQIEAMKDAGIEEIVIVVGKTGAKIKEFLHNGEEFGVKLRYVVDDDPQGIASSLSKAKRVVHGPFALFLGDIFLPKMDISSAIERFILERADGVIIAKAEKDPNLVMRNFEIAINPKGGVTKVIEKPKNPKSLIKGYGLYLFSQSIFEAVSQTPRSVLRGEYEITDTIQTLIDQGGKVLCETWDLWDFNLSYPGDLLMCNLAMLKENGLESFIGEGTKISKGAKIIWSVIGDRSVVLEPIALNQCLVFAGTRVAQRKSAKRMIFADNFIVAV